MGLDRPSVTRRAAAPAVAHGAAGSELMLPAAKLAMTVLGDYWFGSDEYVASSALVAVLAEFGVGEDAARAALSRLCREGRIERVRDGRCTAYRLAAAARAVSAQRGRALLAAVRRRFVDVYDGLGPLGELRVRQLAGTATGAGGPGGPRHHRLADLW